MGLSNSLYASISGLSTMGNAMSVLGDNVSNVNTIAFKSSRSTFQDVLSQSIATAAGSAQVGRGVTLSAVDGLFAQGSFETTSTPTDMAIGGQGFFMLRAADSAASDMYTRAGEFRFDREGYLISPVGHYVQGWSVDSTTEQITGTIGDISLGKNTPPVATSTIEVIVNVDSRKANETSETRLYDAWNGTNAAATVPTDPIASTDFEYTTAIKVFDSKGASHDVNIYFDRTSLDNQWEFLVTCDPSEDKRALPDGIDSTGSADGTNDELTIYAPDTTFDYNNHKGAGALLYGVINFSTNGDIDEIHAYRVPPDGEVDPAMNTNRIVLGTTDSYYSFDTNFTGATTNQSIKVNFGATYSGLTTNQTQRLVTNAGAYATAGQATYITKETLWSSVFDSSGLQVVAGDTFYFAGYDNDGTYVEGSYAVSATEKVQKLLDVIDTTFGASSIIDSSGRIRITDRTGGDSAMYVTKFATISTNSVTPFGGSVTAVGVVPAVIAGDTADYFAADASGNAITSTSTLLTNVYDAQAGPPGNRIALADVFTFTGTAIDGTNVALAGTNTFTVGATSTIANLLDFLEDLYSDGDSTSESNLQNRDVTAILGGDGRIAIFDNTAGGSLAATITYTTSTNGAEPFGNGAVAYTASAVADTQANITTSKQQVVSLGRAVTTTSGVEPAITAATAWTNAYDSSGSGDAVAAGDTFTFAGTDSAGNAVSSIFTVGTDYSSPLTAKTDTVLDLLTWLENEFNAEASIDAAGRLVLTDRTADSAATGGYSSSLAISGITYSAGAPAIFGTQEFETVAASTSGEDGSRMGDVTSSDFTTEALASTQYANSSTTVFQDQNGFAAGFLQSVAVDTDGVITGNYSNGQVLKKAQVALASFNNTAGLRKEGGNIFRETTDSGAPVTGAPGTNGLGSIAPNSLEQSNVDLGSEFVKLITTQRGFQANSKIITTTDEMLADLINIKR